MGMKTHLEAIVDALAEGPMTADALGEVLKENGSTADEPKNSVLGLVSSHQSMFSVDKSGPKALYSLANVDVSAKSAQKVAKEGTDGFLAFKALCARLVKLSRNCKSEEDVKNGLVKPVLEFIGYDFGAIGTDVQFEDGNDGGRTDITLLAKGKQKVLVEIKRGGIQLDTQKNLKQLKDYVHSDENAFFGILTNGTDYIFFYQFYRKKPVIVSFFMFSIEMPTEEAYAQFRSFSKGTFNKTKKMEEAKGRVEKMAKRWKDSIEAAVDEMFSVAEGFFVTPSKREVLKENLAKTLDKWVKDDLGC